MLILISNLDFFFAKILLPSVFYKNFKETKVKSGPYTNFAPSSLTVYHINLNINSYSINFLLLWCLVFGIWDFGRIRDVQLTMAMYL
jgi:hypothetical protein